MGDSIIDLRNFLLIQYLYFMKRRKAGEFPFPFVLCTVDILFSSNRNIHKCSYGLCFWASDPLIENSNKIFQSKGLKPKYKGQTNFYECCDFTKKVCLMCIFFDIYVSKYVKILLCSVKKKMFEFYFWYLLSNI